MLHVGAAHVVGDLIDCDKASAWNMRMSFGKRNKIDIDVKLIIAPNARMPEC
jgi:hypothetical protein